jgi:hypothetical protein
MAVSLLTTAQRDRYGRYPDYVRPSRFVGSSRTCQHMQTT